MVKTIFFDVDGTLISHTLHDVPPSTRAALRQLQEKGIQEPYADVLRELEQRDYDDTHRAVAPLKAAADAVCIDTSDLTLDESINAVCAAIRARFGLEAQT